MYLIIIRMIMFFTVNKRKNKNKRYFIIKRNYMHFIRYYYKIDYVFRL